MGFHPTTGEELLPITKEVVNEWKQQRHKCVPAPVTISRGSQFFDPATGSSQLWYWQSPNGEYEFFDCNGFHPRNGEALKPVDREVHRNYENYIREREKDEEEKKRKAAAEAKRLKDDQEEKERKAAAEAKKRAEAARRCDELAANPNDSQKAGEGVAFGALKNQAREAVASCELAAAQNPS
jgi:hypothetical protein